MNAKTTKADQPKTGPSEKDDPAQDTDSKRRQAEEQQQQ